MKAANFFDAIKHKKLCKDGSLPINEIVNTNHYWFGLSEELFLSMNCDDLVSIIQRGFTLLQKKWGDNSSYTIYAWYEELSGRFRMSAVPFVLQKLPFSCELQEVESLAELATLMWKSHSDTFLETELLINQPCYPLKVYVVRKH